ncbi:hypothetical protein PMI36_03321 [Pseudomonas sp. GM79]|uniref:hypothetical protein n=1 Tax=Pseudomonas sp. GM79 TaxID=1144338 RepID=UPI00026F96A2|nr:hypothetical protein [Pseudomonas sp. GM79]EJN22038.1 hypothetical protein PMI36_03321 [Pseudomonas sp. GM79]
MNTKVSIKGFPRQFDEQELKQRQAGYHSAYKLTDQCYEIVRGAIPFEMLSNVIAHHELGYKLTSKYPASFDLMSYSIRMEKPLHLQQEDLKAIDEREKKKYIEELQQEREHYRELLTQQLLDAAKAKETKKVEDARLKRLADIEKEVSDLFGELVIPA